MNMLHDHETHVVCLDHLTVKGGRAECCYCKPDGHDCELLKLIARTLKCALRPPELVVGKKEEREDN